VRGATTIREQLDKHRRNATCAGCHAKMDPYGFALESFDVMGEWRGAYRAFGVKKTSYRSAVERLIKRVLAGGLWDTIVTIRRETRA